MAEKLDRQDLVSAEALAISSMWEMAALVEVLERKGIIFYCNRLLAHLCIRELVVTPTRRAF